MAGEGRIEVGPIVFFDGQCVFCNRMADLIARLDRARKLRFAPLQGTTAQGHLPKEWIESRASVVFWDGGEVYGGSEAALRILAACGKGPKAVARALKLFPVSLRESVYRGIARNRHRLGTQACRVPDASDPRYLP